MDLTRCDGIPIQAAFAQELVAACRNIKRGLIVVEVKNAALPQVKVDSLTLGNVKEATASGDGSCTVSMVLAR